MTKPLKGKDERTVPEALPLEDEKELLKRYYRGSQLPSPEGGRLEPLRVQMEPDGSGTVFFECTTSSLRYRLPIKKATRTERKKVKDVQEAGGDLDCPRHGPGQKLMRVGKDFVCPRCGVRYGRVG